MDYSKLAAVISRPSPLAFRDASKSNDECRIGSMSDEKEK
jgi:hypothetical protein